MKFFPELLFFWIDTTTNPKGMKIIPAIFYFVNPPIEAKAAQLLWL